MSEEDTPNKRYWQERERAGLVMDGYFDGYINCFVKYFLEILIYSRCCSLY